MDDIVEGVKRVMQAPPEKKTGEDGLTGSALCQFTTSEIISPENLLGFCGYPAAGADPGGSAAGGL